MKKNCFRHFLLAATLVILPLVLFAHPAVSFAEPVLSLDDNTRYDVYIGSDSDGLSVFRGVAIGGVREVGGITFLVIYTDSFNKKGSEGLVSLRYVHAIVPVLRGMNLQGAG